MMLTVFFDISTNFRFSKISVECSVHLCSCPCAVQCRQRLKQTRSSQSTLSKWAWIDSALLPQLTVKSCLLKRKNDNSSMKNIPFVSQSYFLDCVLKMRLQQYASSQFNKIIDREGTLQFSDVFAILIILRGFMSVYIIIITLLPSYLAFRNSAVYIFKLFSR